MPALTLPINLEAITLRAFEPGDFDQFYAYTSLPEVARYVPWPPSDHERGAIRLGRLIGCRTLDKPGDRLMLAICEPGNGALIGEVMLGWAEDEHLQGEVGYALHPGAQGKGLARAAAAEMLRLGFDGAGLHRIIGRCDARNEPSIQLLRRLGMRQEAHLRENEFFKGEWSDEIVLAILADEWRAAQPPH